MQRLEISCAVRRIYTSLGAKELTPLSISQAIWSLTVEILKSQYLEWTKKEAECPNLIVYTNLDL